ncbi:hypothetical protein [Minwuia sp.]|uniref:hypothetical protein n=1 Tax=Minwuia sp. TaxID=2493630 RepID=UPI003A90FABE
MVYDSAGFPFGLDQCAGIRPCSVGNLPNHPDIDGIYLFSSPDAAVDASTGLLDVGAQAIAFVLTTAGSRIDPSLRPFSTLFVQARLTGCGFRTVIFIDPTGDAVPDLDGLTVVRDPLPLLEAEPEPAPRGPSIERSRTFAGVLMSPSASLDESFRTWTSSLAGRDDLGLRLILTSPMPTEPAFGPGVHIIPPDTVSDVWLVQHVDLLAVHGPAGLQHDLSRYAASAGLPIFDASGAEGRVAADRFIATGKPPPSAVAGSGHRPATGDPVAWLRTIAADAVAEEDRP